MSKTPKNAAHAVTAKREKKVRTKKNAGTKEQTNAVQPVVAVVDKKTSRQQISKLIGINLSVSRVRKRVDKSNVNKDIEDACTELRSLLAQEAAGGALNVSDETKKTVERAYTQVYQVRQEKHNVLKERLTKSKLPNDKKRLNELEAFPVRTNTLSEQIDYVGKLRCRFSNDASVVLSSMLDYITQDLVRTAMVNAHTVGKAIIQVSHIIRNDFTTVKSYPLIGCLSVVQNARHVMDVDEEEKDDDDVHDDKNNSTFEFYVNLICKCVKAELVSENESYASIRISKNIRKFCSDVVIQLIERISPLIKLYAHTAKIKTVNDDVIKFIFQFLLIDSGSNCDEFMQFMSDRLEAYRKVRSSDE